MQARRGSNAAPGFFVLVLASPGRKECWPTGEASLADALDAQALLESLDVDLFGGSYPKLHDHRQQGANDVCAVLVDGRLWPTSNNGFVAHLWARQSGFQEGADEFRSHFYLGSGALEGLVYPTPSLSPV